MPFEIVHNDITNMPTEAIVNSANIKLLKGTGVCGHIFKVAGEKELQKECNEIKSCEVGQAVITSGYNLKAKYIIHAVGPIWDGGNYNEERYLRNAYRNSLQLAKKHNIKSISFPLISSGNYGYPKEDALRIAVSTIKEFLQNNDMCIYLVVFDRKAVCISDELYNNVKHYIDKYYEDYTNDFYSSCSIPRINGIFSMFKKKIDLEYILENRDESFTQMVLRTIDEKGKTDIEVYKKANIDRRLFSKIRSNKDYRPKKSTAISLAIALELSLDETKELLAKAGYTLSPSYKFDIIIQYFIENNEFDIYKINEALFKFEQPLLAS